MKKSNLFLIAIVGFVALLQACSPAAVASGNYTGDYYYYSIAGSNSGSATASVTTVNDNTVNVKITANGTDYTFDNVGVTKLEAGGVVQVDFAASNSVATFDGYYGQAGGVNVASFTIDSISNSGYVDFDGSK